MASLVSIVIPTFNRATDLKRALSSIISQTYEDWEVLIVDNHSTDGTDALLTTLADPRISFFKIHNEGIIAASRNLGIEKAKGEFIAFLDSDDWWTPEKLARSMEAMEDGADVVYHDLFLARHKTQKYKSPGQSLRQLASPAFQDLLKNGNALANSSVVVRSEILRRSGPLSEHRDLVGMEDFDAWLRLARHTDRFTKLPEVLGYYWAGGGNTTNPEGSLRALDVLESLYSSDMAKLDMDAEPFWLLYCRGRALFQLRRYSEARAVLRQLNLFKLPSLLALKVGFMLVQSAFGK